MKINWRDATKELPSYDVECVVLYSPRQCIKESTAISFSLLSMYGYWEYINEDDDFYVVTHWCYADELHMPEILKQRS